MKTFLGMLLGGAILAATGCTKEAPLYPGGPVGPAAALNLSSALFVVNAGGAPAMVAARVEDSVGNATSDAVSFASCDPAKVTVSAGDAMDQWTSSAGIAGVTLGVSCVTATGAGMTDTIRVRIAPGSIVLSGPDSMISGTGGTFDMAFYSLDGTLLTAGADFPVPEVKTVNAALLAISATDPLTYDGSARSPGNAVLQVSTNTDFGSVTANHLVTVVPDVFTGTLSAATGAPGSLVTATRAAGATAWDSDVGVSLKGVSAFVDGVTADVVRFAVPATGSTALSNLLFTNIGPDQLAKITTFTLTQPLEDIYWPGNLDPLAGPDVDAVMSPAGNIYMTSVGLCSGGVGADCDDFFTITAGATDRTVTATLTWVSSTTTVAGDFDILWCNADCSAYVGNFDGAGSSKPEVSTVTIPAGATWHLWINNYSQTAPRFSNVKVNLK